MPKDGTATIEEEEEEEEDSKAPQIDSSMLINQVSPNLSLFSQTFAPFPGMCGSLMQSEPTTLSSSTPPTARSPVQTEKTPNTFREQDILLGRGAQYSQNPGNRRFYEGMYHCFLTICNAYRESVLTRKFAFALFSLNSAIDSSIPHYDAAQTKHEKSGVVLNIYQRLSSENCRFLKKNEEDGTFTQIDDKDARQKISHALRYRKQNKSEASLLSTAVKKAHSGSTRNTTFPRVQSDCASNNSALASTTITRENAKKNGQVAIGVPPIFSDEELDSVAPHGNGFPSSFASFQYYSEQDDDLTEKTSTKNDEEFDLFDFFRL